MSQSNVAAAESGVAGQSLAAIQNDYRFQMDQAASRLNINQDMRDYQHSRNIEAAGNTYTNRVSSVQPYQVQPVKPVDYFGPIFGMFGQATDVAIRTDAFGINRPKANPLSS